MKKNTIGRIGAVAIVLLMIASVIPAAIGHPTIVTQFPQNSAIVVGAGAAAADVAGAIDIAARYGGHGILDKEAMNPLLLET